jgi:hypothetical protein
MNMETKTITTEDLEQLRDALCEAIEWIGAVADERSEHPIVMMLQDAMDTLHRVSLEKEQADEDYQSGFLYGVDNNQ